MRAPLQSATLAFIAGILLGRVLLYFPFSTCILLFLISVTTGVFVRLERLALRRSLLIILPGLFGLAAYLYSAAWSPADHYARRIPLDNAAHEITGKIASALDRDPDRTAFVLEIQTVDAMPVTGNVRVSMRDGSTSLGYGDHIRVSGRMYDIRSVQNPGGFDYAAYLAQSGIERTVSVRNADSIEIRGRGSGLFRRIQDLRERIRRAFLASTTGPGSAILQAMVLGEEGGLTDEVRDRFMAAGVTHILSISGSHLGMVAVLCFGLIRWLLFLMPEQWYLRLTLAADPGKIAAWLTLPLVVFYTLLAGGQVATVRSLIMIMAGLAALVLDRDHALMHSLAAAALLLLGLDPAALFDISFQLSFLSVVAIGFTVSLWNELAPRQEGRLRKTAAAILLLAAISIAAALATGPLTAFYFNQVSLVGVLTNLVAVPFAGFVVVPLGLASGIASLALDRLPLPGLNQATADAFYQLVSFFSRFPLAAWNPPSPNLPVLAAFGVLIISGALFAQARLRARHKPLEYSQRVPLVPSLGMTLSGLFLLVSLTLSFLPKSEARITFLDVGQGDSALVELPSGRNILIDAGGTRENRFDTGRRIVGPYLRDRGIGTLDLAVLSHPHPDHMNGLFFLTKRFTIKELWWSGKDLDLPGVEELRKSLDEKHIPVTTVTTGSRERFDGAELAVLHPGRIEIRHGRQKAYAAENDRSLVVKLTINGRSILFTGDIGTGTLRELGEGSAQCDILKVPHHGSKSCNTRMLLGLTQPEAAVVSVGSGNPFRHPAPEVIQACDEQKVRLLRTDQDGAVIVLIKRDGTYRIVSWAKMLLEKVSTDTRAGWGVMEERNWKRLWERMWL